MSSTGLVIELRERTSAKLSVNGGVAGRVGQLLVLPVRYKEKGLGI
jgi:hypothetical protein